MKLITQVPEVGILPNGLWWKYVPVRDRDFFHFAIGFCWRWGKPYYDEFDMKENKFSRGFRTSLRLVKKGREYRLVPEFFFWEEGQQYGTKQWFDRKLWRTT